MKLAVGLGIICLAITALAVVPFALVWVVKQWQLIINGQMEILSLDAYITGLCTLCIIDFMRRIKVPN
jgi:hypothetical protein